MMLDKIEEAIEAVKNGEVIIVVDDEDRENEGDFICAAEKVTPDIKKVGNKLYFIDLSEEIMSIGGASVMKQLFNISVPKIRNHDKMK